MINRRCEADARKGTGTGTCNRPLDSHGQCDRAADHLGDVIVVSRMGPTAAEVDSRHHATADDFCTVPNC